MNKQAEGMLWYMWQCVKN